MPKEKISVLIPVLNEVDSVEILQQKLISVLTRVPDLVGAYEIIFIDDGSSDGTREKLSTLAEATEHCKAIFLRKNFGKSAALAAGFSAATGDFIITMDGDLQDEPDEIPRMIRKINEGYDLVAGWKEVRNDPFEKRFFSKIFNAIASRLTGVYLHDFNCGFKIYRSWCVKNIFLTGNLYRFLPVFVHQQGGKICELSVKHNKRVHGMSKYGMKRYLHGAADLFTITLVANFFQKPMYFFGIIAMPMVFLGGAILFYLIGHHLMWLVTGDLSYQLLNRPLLVLSLGLLGWGLNLVLFGALGELMLQLVGRSQSQMHYTIEKVVENSLPGVK